MAKLGIDDLQILNNALQQVTELEMELARCKECGQDIDEIVATKDDLKQKLEAFKRVYFPDQP